jgi:hypothetical protein
MNFGFLRSPFVRLTAYYVLLGAIMFVLVDRFEVLEGAFSLARLDELAGSGGFPDQDFAAGVETESMRDPLGSAMMTVLAILGCLALLAPVVWVYMITKQREGYDASVVHTVMILPVPVTGLVIVVQDSLALAFSLAGIVAAVRFRNTLKDTKDAVYIFLAIGTALAAGVQALGVAAATSIMFNYLVLVMWAAKIGNIYADQGKRTPKMRLGDVLAGAGSAGAGSGNLTIGDPELLAALAPKELRDIAARKARLVDKVRDPSSKKYNGLLIIYADDSEQCVEQIEEILAETTKDFELSEVSSASDGNATLEYLVVLDKNVPASSLVAGLRERVADHIVAAEYRVLDRKSINK